MSVPINAYKSVLGEDKWKFGQAAFQDAFAQWQSDNPTATPDIVHATKLRLRDSTFTLLVNGFAVKGGKDGKKNLVTKALATLAESK